jgi:hypothetical protein
MMEIPSSFEICKKWASRQAIAGNNMLKILGRNKLFDGITSVIEEI